MKGKDGKNIYDFGNMPKKGQMYYIPNFEDDFSIQRRWMQDNPRICWTYWFGGLVCKTSKEAHDLKKEMLKVAHEWREKHPHKKFK